MELGAYLFSLPLLIYSLLLMLISFPRDSPLTAILTTLCDDRLALANG